MSWNNNKKSKNNYYLVETKYLYDCNKKYSKYACERCDLQITYSFYALFEYNFVFIQI